MIPGFDCIETEIAGVWRVKFTAPSPFLTPTTGREVQDFCRKFDRILLLGVFSWSNYSQAAVRAVQGDLPWFEENGIGLAIFSLENPVQAEQICPGFSPHYYRAAAEPAMVLLAKGSIAKVRFGPIGVEEIKAWMGAGEERIAVPDMGP